MHEEKEDQPEAKHSEAHVDARADAPKPAGALSPTGIYAGPAVVAADPDNLPFRLPVQLVGRNAPIEQINGLLEEHKAVLLAGVDGIGKTAIAAAVAAGWLKSHGGAVLWISAGADNLAGLCDRAARAYGKTEVLRIPEVAEKTAIIRELLSARQPLVVLDDLRNPKGARGFVRWCTGGLSVLATSRKRIAGFTAAEVGPLRRTDARTLFALYAGTDPPPPGDQLKALDELCKAVGDHAYALEMAGKLTAAYDFTPSEVLAHYRAAAGDALTSSLPPAANDGRKHMVAILHASITQLTREGQSVFAALGVTFDEGATAELLAPVAGLGVEDCEEILRNLARMSLARADRETFGTRRYTVSPLAHAYARAILDQKGTRGAAEERMLKSCMAYAERYGQRGPRAHARLDIELGNLLGAVAWAEAHGDHRIASQFAHNLFGDSAFLDTHNYIGTALELLPLALAAARELGRPADESAHLNQLGRLHATLDQHQEADAHHQQALAVAQAANAPVETGNAHRALGDLYMKVGDLARAVEHYGQALELARDHDDRPALGVTLANLGATFALAGDRERAAAYQEQALAISREVGDTRTVGVNLANLGNLYALDAPERAIAYYEEALEIARADEDHAAVISRLNRLGHVRRRQGDPAALEAAAAGYQEALALARQTGARHAEGESLGNLGRLHAQAGDLGAAIDHYTKALAIARETETARHAGNWLFALGESHMELEQWEAAIACLEEAHQIRAAHDDPRAAHIAERLKAARKQAGS